MTRRVDRFYVKDNGDKWHRDRQRMIMGTNHFLERIHIGPARSLIDAFLDMTAEQHGRRIHIHVACNWAICHGVMELAKRYKLDLDELHERAESAELIRIQSSRARLKLHKAKMRAKKAQWMAERRAKKKNSQ